MGASVKVAVFPSRACYFPFEPRSLQSRQLPKNINNLGTASYQMPSSKLFPNGDSVVQKSEVAKL